jgi:alpha-1,6-mannosyltransferase
VSRPLLAGLGVLTGVGLAVAATSQTHLTALSPIRPPDGWKPVYVAGLIGAFACYLIGVALLSRAFVPLGATVAIAAAIQLAPFAAPLLLSTDAYSYWDYGRVATVHNGNPYADRPSRWPQDPAYRRMGADWREKRSVYGPVFTLASEGGARLVGDSARTASLFFRLLAAGGMLVLVAATALAARRSAFAAAFVGWNPLLALHFAGGGHNDVLMAALVVCALLFSRLGGFPIEGAAWAGALSIKLIALVFLPLRGLEALRRRELGRAALGFVLAAGAIAAVASVHYGTAWLTVLSPVANQLRQTSSLGLPYWFAKAGVSEHLTRNLLVALFALLYLFLLWQAWRGRARLALCAVGLLLATAWLQPWYAVWAVPLAALETDRLARLGALALSGYLLYDALPI